MKIAIEEHFLEDLLDYLAEISMRGEGMTAQEVDNLANLIETEQKFAEVLNES